MNLKNLENLGAYWDSRPVYPAHDFASEVKSLINGVKSDDLCIKVEYNGIRLFEEGANMNLNEEELKTIETAIGTAITIINLTDDENIKDMAANIADQLLSLTNIKDK